MDLFCCFYIFFSQNIFTLFVSPYKELLEPTFLVLYNLCEVFGCSITTGFTSTVFWFSRVTISDCFAYLVFFLWINDW